MNKPLSMAQVIQIGASRRQLPAKCPWCGSEPPLASILKGVYIVGCESEVCPANPQCCGDTLEAAWSAWNRRAV